MKCYDAVIINFHNNFAIIYVIFATVFTNY